MGKVGKMRLVKGGRGHDHPGGTETALEALGVEKRLLHRVQLAVPGEPFNRRHLFAIGAEGRIEAAVHRGAVDQHTAGAAVTGVTPLLDSEPAEVTQEGAQALPGAWVFGECLAVDVKG